MENKQYLEQDIPLVVDLDRTLSHADLAVEALVKAAVSSFTAFWQVISWMLAGKAYFKMKLARIAPVNPDQIPYNSDVLKLIETARLQGRKVILASAGHRRNVNRVADHLGTFDAVIASDGKHNLKGSRKLSAIIDLIGETPFDYVGDSAADRPIWHAARKAYTVGVGTNSPNEVRLGSKPRSLGRAILKAARPHQWAKNMLVFVPLVTAGELVKFDLVLHAGIAFALLSIIASSIYLVNDVVDIDADRLHAKKRFRPIASGDLPIPIAVAAAIMAVSLAFVVAFCLLNMATVIALLVYLILTIAYSFRLKSAMITDVIALACLYTIRLQIGASAADVALSFWLLLFSIFFFLSLAYLKRFVELQNSTATPDKLLKGRGYIKDDIDMVAMSGISAGMVSLLIIMLFANAMTESSEYGTPELLWFLVLPLLYWLNRIWLMAKRGQVDGDPVAFAISDRRSIFLGMIIAALILGAKYLH